MLREGEASESVNPASRVAEEPAAPTRGVGHGALWAGIGNIALRLAGILVTAIVARILSPTDFGVFAIALAVYLVVTSLAELGMGSAVARSAHEPSDIAPTVFTIAVGVSTALGVAMALLAGPIASLLGVPEAAGPIRILSLCLALTGVFAVPGAQLTREFRQDRIFLANVAGFVPSTAVLIMMASGGGGATAFAWSRVVGQIVTGTVMYLSVSRVYRPGWQPHHVKALLLFGLPLSLANLVNWSLLNADYLILGRLVSTVEVGIYMIAFSVANWTTTVLGSVLNAVVVPAFGRLLSDRRRLGESVATASGLVGLISLPIALLSVALADPLVHTMFGAKWEEAVPVLQVLALYGGLFSLSLLFANVLIATGRTTRLLLIQMTWIGLLVPGMVVGVRMQGLVGAAWAHVLTLSVVVLPLYLLAVGRATGVRLVAPLLQFLRQLIPALLAAGCGWAVSQVIGPTWLAFLLGGFSGVLVYLALSWRAVLAHLPARWAARLSRRSTSPPEGDPGDLPEGARGDDPQTRRLRIAVLLESLSLGGCPINALDLARTLVVRGHQVVVFAVDEPARVSLLPYARQSGFEVSLLSREAGLLQRAAQIRRLAKEHCVDVVHGYAPFLGPPATLATAMSGRRAALVTNWEMQNALWIGPHTPMIVGTPALYAEAQERHRGPVWLMEPLVDIDADRMDPVAAQRFRESYGLAPDDLVFALVGRVDRVMKLESILYAIEAVALSADPRVRLVIVGDGNAMDTVRAKAEAANTAAGREAVVLTGALEDPRPAYSAADAVLAMGGSSLRALAHSKPVIVLGENGFARLFEPDTAEYFLSEGFFGVEPQTDPVSHLARLMSDVAMRDDRGALGDFGRDRVVERFSLSVAATSLESIYRAALDERPGLVVRAIDGGFLLAKRAAGITVRRGRARSRG